MSRRLALTAALAAVALAVPAAADEEVDPSAEELAESVTAVRLDGAVTGIRLDGSVTPLETREQEGTRTTVTVSSDVLFAFGSDAVAPDAAERLRALAAEVPAGADVTVVGHTDAVGDDAANDALSLRRADAVAAVLREAAPGLTLTTEGRGEREPVAPNTTGGEDDPLGRAANRRVTIAFDGPGA